MERPADWGRLVNEPLTEKEAERVRTSLARHQVGWAEAVIAHADVTKALQPDQGPRWFSRMELPPRSARVLFELQPGAVSPVLGEDLGYAVYQLVERREHVSPPRRTHGHPASHREGVGGRWGEFL